MSEASYEDVAGHPPRYRVGRHLGRTIYDEDELIGIMDTIELGQHVVDALNAWVEDNG